MSTKKKLIVGNWKMNPGTLAEARDLFRGVVRKVARVKGVTIVVCPPMMYMADLVSSYGGTAVSFGAQDVSAEQKKVGSLTGETSASMLKRLGVSYAIVGHSERRVRGETDKLVSEKVKASLKAGIIPILCVGESMRDEEGHYLRLIEEQIMASLKGVSRQNAQKVVVAYEPIWAIGKSAKNAAQPEDVHQMVLFIRKVLAKQFSRKVGKSMRVIYGGSVEPANAEALMHDGGVDGFLPGHASLVPEDFSEVIKSS